MPRKKLYHITENLYADFSEYFPRTFYFYKDGSKLILQGYDGTIITTVTSEDISTIYRRINARLPDKYIELVKDRLVMRADLVKHIVCVNVSVRPKTRLLCMVMKIGPRMLFPEVETDESAESVMKRADELVRARKSRFRRALKEHFMPPTSLFRKKVE